MKEGENQIKLIVKMIDRSFFKIIYVMLMSRQALKMHTF